MLANDQRAMPLVLAQALLPQQTVMTVGAELKAVTYLARRLFEQTAALRIDFPRRTNRFAFLNVDLKICGREPALYLPTGQCRPDNLSALSLGLRQLLRRHIRGVHILHWWLLQTHLRLLLLHLLCSSLVVLIGRMGYDTNDEIARRFARGQDRFAHTLGHLYLVAHMLFLLFSLAF